MLINGRGLYLPGAHLCKENASVSVAVEASETYDNATVNKLGNLTVDILFSSFLNSICGICRSMFLQELGGWLIGLRVDWSAAIG